jgi:hypothetical protein
MVGYCGQRSCGTRKGEPSNDLCDRSTPTGPALLVRGSSRRITIMQAGRDARSANIRVINRRQEPLRPLLEIPHLLKRRE